MFQNWSCGCRGGSRYVLFFLNLSDNFGQTLLLQIRVWERIRKRGRVRLKLSPHLIQHIFKFMYLTCCTVSIRFSEFKGLAWVMEPLENTLYTAIRQEYGKYKSYSMCGPRRNSGEASISGLGSVAFPISVSVTWLTFSLSCPFCPCLFWGFCPLLGFFCPCFLFCFFGFGFPLWFRCIFWGSWARVGSASMAASAVSKACTW